MERFFLTYLWKQWHVGALLIEISQVVPVKVVPVPTYLFTSHSLTSGYFLQLVFDFTSTAASQEQDFFPMLVRQCVPGSQEGF